MTHLLTLDELTPGDLDTLLAQARQLKRARQAGAPPSQMLAGKTVALLFEKPSLRTRVSFEVAARELGGNSLYLSPQEVGLGARESIADVARVLSAYVHAVVLRTFRHAVVEEFARHATIPVINGLTDEHHPCQALADVFTIAEHFGSPSGRTLAYVGDGNNVAHSLLQAAAKAGMCIRVATPAGYEPNDAVLDGVRRDAARTGAHLSVLRSPEEAVAGADAVYTDVWTSMGQEAESAARRAVFAPYRVDAHLLALAAPDAIVLHPLPAHRGEEITDDVLDGPKSRVFVQAENRLHVQKAVLRALVATEARVEALTA
ncbi:MAG: ornithine carbamoyltransferase [Ktedonobacterales bacterium]